MLRKPTFVLLILTAFTAVLPVSAQTVIDQIPIAGTSTGIAINPINNKIYVASISSSEESKAIISLIDGQTRTVTKTVPLGFDTPGKVIVNPVTQRVYMQACNFLFVANPICDLLVFDSTLNVLADLPNTGPAVAVNPRTNRIYILNENGFAILNGQTNQIVGQINLPGAGGVGVDPLRERMFTIVNNDELVIIDLDSNRIRDRVAIEPGADAIGVNPVTQRGYITHPNFVNTDPTQLTVLDLNNLHIVTHILIGPSPNNVSVDFRADVIFVGNGDSLTAIDGARNTILTTIDKATSAESDLASGLVYATTDLVFFDDTGISGRVDVIKEPRLTNQGKGKSD
jgi:DNA-binding beta-propeller fold protein YncE